MTAAPAGRRVLVGMSGGIDSTAAALLLREQGFEPVGATLILTPPPDNADNNAPDNNAAAAAARRLGIPHETVDARTAFSRHVLAPSWRVLEAGGTPNPCVFCNARVRFPLLAALADERGIPLIATGHYARLLPDGAGGFRLARGIDATKDQSYFLHAVPPGLFPRILFPLGEMTKTEVREWARVRGLREADAPESQDICLAGPDGGFAEKLRALFSGRATPGVFVDEQGRQLGRHGGIHRFTVGQRKGLGFAAGERVRICRIDPASGTITVSARPGAASRASAASDDFHWIGAPPPVGTRISAQVRHRQPPAAAGLAAADGRRVEVRFDAPVFGVTPGQSLVLYDGDTVLGGGPIRETPPPDGKEKEALHT